VPGLFDRVARLARSPKGQQVISQATAKAQQLAQDPKNRARVQRLRDEVTRRINPGDAAKQPPTTPTTPMTPMTPTTPTTPGGAPSAAPGGQSPTEPRPPTGA